jgi:hypothetical protein
LVQKFLGREKAVSVLFSAAAAAAVAVVVVVVVVVVVAAVAAVMVVVRRWARIIDIMQKITSEQQSPLRESRNHRKIFVWNPHVIHFCCP